MRQIDLSRLRRRVVLGSAGHIRLLGEGVAAKHADIVIDTNGDGVPVQLLRPVEGHVVVRRRGQEFAVLDQWQLADADVLIIGVHRITYRNLDSRPQADRKKGAIQWMQS